MKPRLNTLLFILTALGIAGCSPGSYEDFQNEGRAECRKMVVRLSQVHSKEQLEQSLPLIKKRFDKIVDLAIAARTYQIEHPGQETGQETESAFDNSLFIKELNRIYQIEGGKELIEEAQREALLKLDAFERQILAKKGSIVK